MEYIDCVDCKCGKCTNNLCDYYCDEHIGCSKGFNGDCDNFKLKIITKCDNCVEVHSYINIDDIKQNMLNHVEQAKRHIEKALNLVECEDVLNNGQSQEINEVYKKIAKVYDEFEIFDS